VGLVVLDRHRPRPPQQIGEAAMSADHVEAVGAAEDRGVRV
jgi:hypothetical protein